MQYEGLCPAKRDQTDAAHDWFFYWAEVGNTAVTANVYRQVKVCRGCGLREDPR